MFAVLTEPGDPREVGSRGVEIAVADDVNPHVSVVVAHRARQDEAEFLLVDQIQNLEPSRGHKQEAGNKMTAKTTSVSLSAVAILLPAADGR